MFWSTVTITSIPASPAAFRSLLFVNSAQPNFRARYFMADEKASYAIGRAVVKKNAHPPPDEKPERAPAHRDYERRIPARI